MNLSEFSTTQIALVIAVVAVMIAMSIAIWFSIRKRRTEKLRAQFGRAEYSRAVTEGGSQRKAEAALDKRAERVGGGGLHIRPLAPADRDRFVESWARIQCLKVRRRSWRCSNGSRQTTGRRDVRSWLSGERL